MGRNYSQAGLLTVNIYNFKKKKVVSIFLKEAICDF